MNTKIILLFLCCFTLSVFSQYLNNSSKDNKSKEREFSSSEIMSKIDEIYEKLKNEDLKDNPLFPTQFSSFHYELQEISKYSKLEKTTKIYKEWFVKLTNIIKAMVTCRVDMKIATMNKDRELYIKSKQTYDKYFKAFEEAYKDPPKIRGK